MQIGPPWQKPVAAISPRVARSTMLEIASAGSAAIPSSLSTESTRATFAPAPTSVGWSSAANASETVSTWRTSRTVNFFSPNTEPAAPVSSSLNPTEAFPSASTSS